MMGLPLVALVITCDYTLPVQHPPTLHESLELPLLLNLQVVLRLAVHGLTGGVEGRWGHCGRKGGRHH